MNRTPPRLAHSPMVMPARHDDRYFHASEGENMINRVVALTETRDIEDDIEDT